MKQLPTFMPTLIRLLLSDLDGRVRQELAYDFRSIPDDEEAVSALGQAAATDPSSDVRLIAIESLSPIGTSSAIKQLKTIATSQTGEIKKAAEDALEALGQS